MKQFSQKIINIQQIIAKHAKRFDLPNNRRWLGIVSILPVLCLSTSAFADRAFRCHGSLVYIGDMKAEVLSTCGKPDHVDRWEEVPHGHRYRIFDYEKERYQLPERIKGPVRFERWTYNLGSNRFARYLLFQNGELYKIERGDK